MNFNGSNKSQINTLSQNLWSFYCAQLSSTSVVMFLCWLLLCSCHSDIWQIVLWTSKLYWSFRGLLELKKKTPSILRGGLISEERFSLWLKSPQKGTKNYPEHYPPKEKIVIWHHFWGRFELKWKNSLLWIKPPLVMKFFSLIFFSRFLQWFILKFISKNKKHVIMRCRWRSPIDVLFGQPI